MTDQGGAVLQEQAEQFRTFLKNTLRPELKRLRHKEAEVEQEINDYQDLIDRLALIQEKSLQLESVDLGHRMVFCHANIPDTSRIFVHVGMGFHVELTLTEAVEYSKKRIHFLRSIVFRNIQTKITKVVEHIRSTEELLDVMARERG